MDWNDVEIFLAIARQGTLGAAAKTLGVTQPTMGRRLKVLETALGQTLFQRTADGFVLTDEGHAARIRAERMEEEALGLQRELSGQQTEISGILRLSAYDWFGAYVLTPIIATFTRDNPRVTVELVADARQYNLSRRETDLAFRITPFKEPDVVSRKLMRMEYSAYIAKGSKRPTQGDGAGFQLITMDEALGYLPDVPWLRRTFPNATIAARSNSRDAQAMLCRQGAGIAVLPKPVAKMYPDLQELRLPDAPPSRDTYIGYHRDLRRLSRLRKLLDLVVERLG